MRHLWLLQSKTFHSFILSISHITPISFSFHIFPSFSPLQAGRTQCSCESHPRAVHWVAVWVVVEVVVEEAQGQAEAWQQAVWAPVTACWCSRLSNTTACQPCRMPLQPLQQEEAESWEEAAQCLPGRALLSGHHWFMPPSRLQLPPVM